MFRPACLVDTQGVFVAFPQWGKVSPKVTDEGGGIRSLNE